MTHSFTSYLGSCDFNSASVADLTFETDFLILTAVALPVLGRSENSFTVKTVTFRFLGSVIYSFRSFNCTI